MEASPTTAIVVKVEEVEMDEMWSFVQSKRQQRWLWHAINHRTGAVLAYVLAPHEDAALKQLPSFVLRLRLSGSIRIVGARTCDCWTRRSTRWAKQILNGLSAST
ncbi:MAG: hypothetical protein KME18_28220 [Phormidium tanganyikae FI6-MK23]|nr:hypothetical protein [Phormidium tanganyikae FI6-MK23]